MSVGLLRGATLYASLVIGALALFVLLSPVFLTIFVHSTRLIRLRRQYCDFLSGAYLNFAAALLTSGLCGTKLFLYSNSPQIKDDRGVLMLSNHRCRVDWMYSGFCYCSYLKSNGQLRFVLKDTLRSVPFFGWCMSAMMYIFLTRNNRELDLAHMKKVLKYLIGSGTRPVTFLFPEGTDLTPSNLAKSHDYCGKHGLPKMDYVLCPKISGVEVALNELRGDGAPCHDITVAYKDYHPGGPGDTRPSEKSMWSGKFPQEVHISVRRFDVDELPADRNNLERWVLGSFAQKEKLLRSFYENGSVPPSQKDVQMAISRLRNNASVDEDADKKMAAMEAWPEEIPMEISILKPILVVLGWTLGCSFFIYNFSWMRWYLLVITVYSTGARAIGNGFDLIELYLHSSIIDCEVNDTEGKKVD